MPLALAHAAPEVLDHVHRVGGVDWLHDWTFDPIFLIPLGMALLYWRGLRRYRARGGKRFPLWRQALLYIGVGGVAAALLSPVDALADWSFTWHMLQHELLMVFAVPLILLGTPFLPVVWGLPASVRRAVFIPVARNRPVRAVVKWATHPVVGLLAYWALVWIWHAPPWYNAAFRNEWIHYGQHFSFVLGAGLFWWDIVSPYPFPSRINVFLKIMMVFLSEIPNMALSALIVFSDDVLYAYNDLPGFWGLSMLEEQRVGGLLMWVALGATVRLLAALLLLAAHFRAEEVHEPWSKHYRGPIGQPVTP